MSAGLLATEDTTDRTQERPHAPDRAVSITVEQPTDARLADALMYAGRFSEALSVFEEYESRPLSTEPIWRLKAAALRYILHHLRPTDERIRPEKAAELGRAAQLATDAKKAEQLAFLALEDDPMSPDAWFAVAKVFTNEHRDYSSARYPALIGALGDRAPDVWAESYLVAVMSADVALATLICEQAIIDHGATFTEALRVKVADFPVQLRDSVLQGAVKLAREVSTKPKGFTLRMTSPGEDIIERFR